MHCLEKHASVSGASLQYLEGARYARPPEVISKCYSAILIVLNTGRPSLKNRMGNNLPLGNSLATF